MILTKHSASKLTALGLSVKSCSPPTPQLLLCKTNTYHVFPHTLLWGAWPSYLQYPTATFCAAWKLFYLRAAGFFNQYGFDKPCEGWRGLWISVHVERMKPKIEKTGTHHPPNKRKRETRLTLFGWPELWSMWILTEFPSTFLSCVENKIKVLNKEGWEKLVTPGPIWCTNSKNIHFETICFEAKHVSCNTICESKQIMPGVHCRTWNKASYPKPTPLSDCDWCKVRNAK